MARLSSKLEHRVLKYLRAEPLPRRWLLAVSGGLDSIVLAEMIWRWRRLLKLELAIAYVHHGSDGPQSEYRTQAQAHVRAWAKRHGVRFVSNHARPLGLRSEAELRDFRRTTLERFRRKTGSEMVVLAHHRDDLVETRLLRLIRGSGPQGLRGMSLRNGIFLRPLLSLSRDELQAYAVERELNWVEDPSNARTEALRNWLRREWLPLLERRQSGALKSLARSLEILAPAQMETRLRDFVGLRRKALHRLSSTRQQAVVAEYLNALGLQGYSRAHIEEILKRLRTRRGEFEFEMLEFRFRVTPDLVWASRV